ncbi:hypothetical protein GH714_014710 [Hevea brasiliensis]|uniref:Uncharacterized protein n=1 Tax=Hevea brasiliensis TaxID=3981 RepID=A0A6A6L8W0_HEVBR|nr:hypothetical protein GH714_014710 [Hevea brasiliensis]
MGCRCEGIADQIEDLIDEYMYYVYRQQHFTKLHRIFRTPKTLLETRQIASKLQQINKTIKGMDERRQRYGIDRIEGSNDHYNFPLYQRDLALFMKEDDVVGFVDESRLLKTWLMDKEEHRTLISTVGMGDLTYTRDDLLRSLIKEFHQSRKEEVPNDLGTKDFKDLVGILIGHLEQKKYLVVLDDVWDTNLWEAIKVSLPNNQFGSRIMLTTRKQDVGSYSSDVRSHILTIKPLKEEEAWDLFCMKAFSSCRGNSCPKELEPWALELVRKCKGLPLAVVALGGLLSSKKSITEWSSVCDNLNWQLNNNQMLEVVKSILLLSFSDLPSPLKHCFLYCCLFPEDYEIRRKRLIKLWIAEGFVQQVDRTAPKEVAESYLMELILRSMLQVVRRNEFGRPKRCKMHDLLREIGLSISEKEKFGVVYDGKVEIGECESHQARRLSIQTTKWDLQSYSSITRLRSLFVFVNGSVSFSNTLMSKFKLLRTLDLENAAIDVLPEELGTLFNLRYLNLRGTPMAELPKSIGELRNLELLDISETNIKELPSEVAKLQNLRHLNMWSKFIADIHNFELVRGMQVPFEISKLKKLQVMANIEAEGNIIKQLRRITIRKGVMPDIQELWIDSCLMLNAVPYGIESLTNLQSLLLTNCSASLIGRVNDVESKDRSKVLHIPNIKCFKRRGELP